MVGAMFQRIGSTSILLQKTMQVIMGADDLYI